MKTITIAEVEYLAFRLAKEHLSFDKPLPDFSTRYPNVLESCVLTPFQRFSGKALYPTLVSKAAILFYLMIKNHPFLNGNE
ncbi:Fic family protein [bacterium]|nr:Fic family protein [bacterium]